MWHSQPALLLVQALTLNILVSVVNVSKSKALFCKDWTENGQILVWTSSCFSYFRCRMESKTLMSFKHCKLCTSLTSNLHGVCGSPLPCPHPTSISPPFFFLLSTNMWFWWTDCKTDCCWLCCLVKTKLSHFGNGMFQGLCCTSFVTGTVLFEEFHFHFFFSQEEFTCACDFCVCVELCTGIEVVWACDSLWTDVSFMLLLSVGCLMSQQHASVSQGGICSDNFTCCQSEMEVADQTFHFTQSQYTDTGPTSPSTDPITPGTWQVATGVPILKSLVWLAPEKIPAQARFK